MRMLSGVGLLIGSVLLGGCGTDQSIAPSAAIEVQPNPVSFSATAVGDQLTRTFEVESVGDAPLLIESMTIEGGNGAFSLSSEFTYPIELEPEGLPLAVYVVYEPTTLGGGAANVLIRSNALNGAEYSVNLVPATSGTNLFVDPDPVVFGRVAPGETLTRQVNVSNNGNSGIELVDMMISGSNEFLLNDQELTYPHQLGPNEYVTISIDYSPESDGSDDGALIIGHRSEGAAIDDIVNKSVAISANGTQPCIEVTHEDGFDFRQRMIGSIVEEIFVIRNCGDELAGQILAISSMEWSTSHDWFSFSAEMGLDQPLELDNMEAGIDVELEPGDYRTFMVAFSPLGDEVANAVLSIDNNDPMKDPLEIDINGVGSPNECPIASAVCEVRGTGIFSDEVGAIPLDYVDCDASDSRDDGSVTSYFWEVVSRPNGSTSDFSPSSEAVDPSFFLDLAGRYTLRLNVMDDEGTISCEPSDVTIIATPNEAILAELVWNTPEDPDETDESGADLDIHFVYEDAEWGDPVYDTFWRNPEPNWGNVTRGDDNPSLDRDDTDGSGPEDINLDNPETNSYYRVGVHYFHDRNLGISYATMRIFINGSEAYVYENKPLNNEDNELGKDLWEVATIQWPSGEIIEINTITDFELPPEPEDE